MQGQLQGWDLNNVFNANETSFFWKSIQNHGLSTKGLPRKKLDKTQMSVLVMTTATGTEKIHLLFIATAKKPCCFGKKEGQDLGFWYFYNQKVWMGGAECKDEARKAAHSPSPQQLQWTQVVQGQHHKHHCALFQS